MNPNYMSGRYSPSENEYNLDIRMQIAQCKIQDILWEFDMDIVTQMLISEVSDRHAEVVPHCKGIYEDFLILMGTSKAHRRKEEADFRLKERLDDEVIQFLQVLEALKDNFKLKSNKELCEKLRTMFDATYRE